MIQAGKLDRRIIIEEKTAEQDASGHESYTWSTFYDTWAEVKPLGALERFNAEGKHAVETKAFIVRYKEGVSPTMRVSFENTYWQITGVEEYGRRLEGLRIVAETIS